MTYMQKVHEGVQVQVQSRPAGGKEKPCSQPDVGCMLGMFEAVTQVKDMHAGAASDKPANRRRRGGRNRNKGVLVSEAGAADSGAAEMADGAVVGPAAEADVADSMAQLQLDRLASNGTAGTHQTSSLYFRHAERCAPVSIDDVAA